ncbi:protein PFC0760c-like [Leptopilina boulardi]|uniref:protein PFC0760c-like n=1 Tax=Leptopilina boulardi TaxID=63433 RepID=UPI0021F637D8|nr:protein PFC0760c-like [Leptopilina boulardi]
MKNCQCIDDHNHKKQHVSNNSDDSGDKIKTSINSEVEKISQNEKGWHKNQNKLITELDSRNETERGENLKISLDHVKPYPFTFITAVKRKFALGEQSMSSDICKKIREQKISNESSTTKRQISNCQLAEKMDFIKPLKVPDLKISPKTIDYPQRESSSLSEVSSVKKFNMISKDNIQKEVKLLKSSDRVQRKLDFSSSDASLLQIDNDDDNDPTDVSVLSLIKKKDRDHSRDKENRSKRIKKDDSSCSSKGDNFSQDSSKRLKSTKSTTKRDVPELVFKKIGAEHFLCHTPRVSDFGMKKSRNKHFTTSTLKKDDEKKYRCSNIQYSKSLKDKSLKLKGRFINSESISLSERSAKLQDRISTKESYSDTFTESDDWKSKEENNLHEDDQNKLSDNRHSKSKIYNNRDIECKEQIKRIKHKYSNSKIDSYSLSTSDILEEVETASDSNVSYPKKEKSESCETFSQATKIKDKVPLQNLIQTNESRVSEVEFFNPQNSVKNDNSSLNNNNNNNVNNSMTNDEINTESQISMDTSLSEMLLDPRKISFRDNSYSQQNEFSDLVTPDMNLMLRSNRRRRQFLQSNKESPQKNVKNKQTMIMETEEKSSQSLHPAVLKMKFQAEERHLNSFSESVRQATYESNLYNNSSCEDGMQSEETVNNEIRKQLVALRSEANEEINKEENRSLTKALHDADICFVNKTPTKGSTLLKKTLEENIHGQELLTKNLTDKLDTNNIDNKLKLIVKMAEVQTQTANDIATQTDINFYQSRMLKKLEELSGITYERGAINSRDIPQFSLESLDQDKDFGQLDDISLASRMKAMSEISLHETTSSIKTESGTEISISTRDVTCSFNKDLALEMAQLVQDEKQRYDKIQMLFKSHEKTLNDRTKKLVKLEEQKRQLRDTGQDSRISSVKKKQRALLLKLQQEKDEMNRLKELHKIASQERKLMLQKHRDMFNPEMSTKNILTKLKRSADCQSPRRLSGPMKGYDIRSNSSMSSLVDSDKSQLDRSQLKTCDTSFQKSSKQFFKVDVHNVAAEKSDSDHLENINIKNDDNLSNICRIKPVKNTKYDIKSRKFEEKMPGGDVLRQIELHSKLKRDSLCELPESSKESENLCLSSTNSPKSICIDERGESDEKLTRKTKTLNSDKSQQITTNSESDIDERTNEFLQINSIISKKIEKNVKKIENISDCKTNSKRKGYKSQKTKVANNELLESVLKSKSDSQICQHLSGHHNKRSKLDIEQSDDNYDNSILEKFDFSESQNSLHALLKHSKAVNEKNYQLLRDITSDSEDRGNNIENFDALDKKNSEKSKNFSQKEQVGSNMGNLSTRSQVSTLTISRHSSGDSEKSYSRSVVIRSHDHRFKTSKKLEQILNAREAALASRRSCVEEWIAWHTRLREEENRVARMEQAAYKLVNATSKALFYHDTSVSSEASDVEGRIDALAQKLADRRAEMAKLKKEAKRQAKQRLRAMEVSLLNQIKKYDATIHDMRKALETKKEIIKNCEKMPIESKSVSDFRVPKIPIQKIHDICKSSDLLPQQEIEDNDKIIAQNSKLLRNRQEITKQSNFSTSNEFEETEMIKDTTNKSNSEFNILTQTQENSSKISENLFQENSSKISENLYQKNSSKISENLYQENNSKTSDNLFQENSSEIKNISLNKSDTLKSINSEKEKIITDKYSDSITHSVENDDLPTISTENISFSKKLDSLGANGKNLNDDISVLESDLKTLSEMMLQLSNKKSINKSINKNENIYSDKKKILENSKTFESKTSSIPSLFEKINDADSINEVDDIVSNDDDSYDKLSKNIDFKAKSKEILNEIEKSIIGDHMKIHQTDNLHENKILSNDLVTLKDDTISEILSLSKTPTERNKSPEKSVSENSAIYDNDLSKLLLNENTKNSLKFLENNEFFNDRKNSENLELDYHENSITEEYSAITEENKISSSEEIHEKELSDSLESRDKEKINSENSQLIESILEKTESEKENENLENLNSEKEEFSDTLNSITIEKNDLKKTEEETPNDEIWFDEKNHELLSSTKRDDFSPLIQKSSFVDSENRKSSLVNISLREEEENDNEDMGESIRKLFSFSEEINNFEISESTEEQYSSEGEQLDNLVEIVEDKLETLEKTSNLENWEKTFIVDNSKYEDISEENFNTNDVEKSSPVSEKIETERYSLGKNNEIQSLDDDEEDDDEEEEEEDERETRIDDDDHQISMNYYEKHSSDDSSESSEDDTNKDTSEPIITSPRDKDDSRLEIDNLNDDLLSSITIHQNLESKGDYQVTPIVTNAEKEIMATIDKLKASLKQPGLEVAECDATLLKIEQLQIELEIKKLEAEEVSFYVREIPNKPPPPYTPPSSGKLSSSKSSPSPPPAVIPTNADDLTVFIERATSIIFKAKENGENIMNLEAPPEIWELRKDNDSLKKDRRIYNTFLFDLCKETIAEVYCVNDDKPGPSWTRPNVKTKTAIKVPKSLDELTDYVNKEVATLFGFKTKLQRENMVMRWSRKRRDRVDELLAREAQAEEEEWTKFHYDELAVKNELTVAILDSIILETVNVVKTAFTKKRKLKV